MGTIMNEHIVYFLDGYLKISEPDFAVMLKGERGGGKTYSIQNYLSAEMQKNRSENSLHVAEWYFRS